MRDLQARYEQMKNLERVTQNEKIRLTRKIPEIEKNLEALNALDANHTRRQEEEEENSHLLTPSPW